MAQDIRKMMSAPSKTEVPQLKDGHRTRFEQKLSRELPIETDSNTKKSSLFLWMKIAAVVVIAFGVVWFVGKDTFAESDTEIVSKSAPENTLQEPEVLLSDISPDFKKVEDYYLGNIKLELARLDVTDDNKELIDSFMSQLENLNTEYRKLNSEITEAGVSEEMVLAMIENLKLRLDLLFKLKSKLKELKAEAPSALSV